MASQQSKVLFISCACAFIHVCLAFLLLFCLCFRLLWIFVVVELHALSLVSFFSRLPMSNIVFDAWQTVFSIIYLYSSHIDQKQTEMFVVHLQNYYLHSVSEQCVFLNNKKCTMNKNGKIFIENPITCVYISMQCYHETVIAVFGP